MVSGETRRRDEVVSKLLNVWPALPLAAYGLWAAWMALVFSGSLWLSDVETDGDSVTKLFTISMLANAAACFVAAWKSDVAEFLLRRPKALVGAGCMAAAGAALIIVAGPYYMGDDMAAPFVFNCGSILAGVGMAFIMLRCGAMFGDLPPRRAILNVSLSQITAVFVFFCILGSPAWSPVPGGPTLISIIAFVGLPIAASLFACMEPVSGDGQELRPIRMRSEGAAAGLGKLAVRGVLALFILSFACSMVRGFVIQSSVLEFTLASNTLLVLVRVAIAVALAMVAVFIDVDRIDLGRFYVVIVASLALLIVLLPVVGQHSSIVGILVTIANFALELAAWCLLAFVVYQKRLSAAAVFGFGFGMLTIGDSLGWSVGAYRLTGSFGDGSVQIMFVLIAGVMTVASLVLFSEREIKKITEAASDEEPSLAEAMAMESLDWKVVPEAGSSEGDRRRKVIDQAIEEYRLTPREGEVLACLLTGRSAEWIADELCVSLSTTRSHTRNIYTKLDVHSREELFALFDERSSRPAQKSGEAA